MSNSCTVLELVRYFRDLADEGYGNDRVFWQSLQRVHVEDTVGEKIPEAVWDIFVNGFQNQFADQVSEYAFDLWRNWDEDEKRETFASVAADANEQVIQNVPVNVE